MLLHNNKDFGLYLFHVFPSSGLTLGLENPVISKGCKHLFATFPGIFPMKPIKSRTSFYISYKFLLLNLPSMKILKAGRKEKEGKKRKRRRKRKRKKGERESRKMTWSSQNVIWIINMDSSDILRSQKFNLKETCKNKFL